MSIDHSLTDPERHDEVQRLAQANLKIIAPDRWQLPFNKGNKGFVLRRCKNLPSLRYLL